MKITVAWEPILVVIFALLVFFAICMGWVGGMKLVNR